MAATRGLGEDVYRGRPEQQQLQGPLVSIDDEEYSGGSTAEILNSPPPPPFYRVQDPPNIRCKRCRTSLDEGGARSGPPAAWKLVAAAAMTVGAIAFCFLFVAWYRAGASDSTAATAAADRRALGRAGRDGWGRDTARHRAASTTNQGGGCVGCVEGSHCRRLEDGSLICTQNCLAAEEWPCRSGLCVSKYSRCDGLADCDDLSDEVGCPCDEDVNFRCGLNTSCLPLDRRCDGRADCWDIADELHCPVEECPPGDPKAYHCHSWHCISSELVCDGEDDCDDGSDEGGCPVDVGVHE